MRTTLSVCNRTQLAVSALLYELIDPLPKASVIFPGVLLLRDGYPANLLPRKAQQLIA